MDTGFDDQLKEGDKFRGTVRHLTKDDLPHLKPIIETFVRDSETKEIITKEVEDTLKAMEQSVDGANDRTYVVAEHDGKVLGVMGAKTPEPKMLAYAETGSPIEFINAFVAEEHRGGKGVGTALFDTLAENARLKGYREIIVNSGPRYKETGWPFWDKMMGARVGLEKDFYGPRRDAPVWRKPIIWP